MSIGEDLKRTAKGALFEIGMIAQPEQFEGLLNKALEQIQPAMIGPLVDSNITWPIKDEYIERISDYRDFIAHIGPERLLKMLTEVRPDLVEAMQAKGRPGGDWFIRNVEELKAKIMAVPELPPETIQEYQKQEAARLKQESDEVENLQTEIPIDDGVYKEDKLIVMACGACAEKDINSNWIVAQGDLDRIKYCPFCREAVSPVQIPEDELGPAEEEIKKADETVYHKRIG